MQFLEDNLKTETMSTKYRHINLQIRYMIYNYLTLYATYFIMSCIARIAVQSHIGFPKMRLNRVLLLAILYLSENVSCGKILVVMPLPAYSHSVPFVPLFKALAEKGHQVTYLSPFAEKLSAPNITSVDVNLKLSMIGKQNAIIPFVKVTFNQLSFNDESFTSIYLMIKIFIEIS